MVDPVPEAALNPAHSDKIVHGGTHTVREAQAAGGRAGLGKKRIHRQKRNSALTPMGTLWSQVRADWETGAFSVRALADAHGVDHGTLRNRMDRESWGDRPTAALVQKALPGLVEAVEAADPESASIETLLAAAEGRKVDLDELAAEKASASAQRKALVLRNHRGASDRYYALAMRSMELLEGYANGNLLLTTVQGKDPRGEQVHMVFHLLSKQHGLMDGVQKVGAVLEQAIKLQCRAHGLEEVDGDGNKRAPGGGQDLLRSKTTEEIQAAVASLLGDLSASGRETPIPPGLSRGI